MINDAERPPSEEQVQALRAYEVEPLLWSRRRDALARHPCGANRLDSLSGEREVSEGAVEAPPAA
jgi:hypothetical protein